MATYRFAPIILLAFLTGCAVHAPMSEMIMFEEKNTIGARGILTLISAEGNLGPGFMYVYFSYNYNIDVEVEYPRIGLSIGLY